MSQPSYFELYRVRIFENAQTRMFADTRDRPELLKAAVENAGQVNKRRRIKWLLGKPHYLKDGWAMVRIGVAKPEEQPKWTGEDFTDEPEETYPYTLAFINLNLSFVAIGRNAKVAPETSRIALRFSELLENSKVFEEANKYISVERIPDPNDLIFYIKKSLRIEYFWVNIPKPNPIDINKDIMQPASKVVLETKSERGRLELKGPAPNDPLLEELVRSAASSGENAGGKFLMPREKRARSKQLKGRFAGIEAKGIDNEQKQIGFCEELDKKYSSVRGKNLISDDE